MYVLFGAGAFGLSAVSFLGKDNIAFIVDNDSNKNGQTIEEIPVYVYNEKRNELDNYTVVIAVSRKYVNDIESQLVHDGLTNYCTFQDLLFEDTKKKIISRTDYISIYNKAVEWIKSNTIDGKGIINNSSLKKPYPEVTGYYIPTLIKWGYKDLAVQYAKWLCSIQKPDGSWYDTEDKAPYVFDTAQILKGLIAVREIYNCVDENIIKGCDWILSNMQSDGRLTTPDRECWGSDTTVCSELIHLYCLSPLKDAGEILKKDSYISAANKILKYYKDNCYDEIMNFGLLSHFYAYVMEALLDMGEIDMAREAMKKLEKLQNEDGMVPAYNNVHWVCSTGLFQLAIVWFRLGNIECGSKAFKYACDLQNESGGWYGSYPTKTSTNEDNTYFATSEISWAVKYFLDALYYKNITEFNMKCDTFLDKIDKQDKRYQFIKQTVMKYDTVLEAGCGKGRYLNNLAEDVPQNKYFGIDISEDVMKKSGGGGCRITKAFGSLTDIPYADNFFDVVYTCEALEHAVDIKSAIREMVRVTKPEGKIIVIDKNKSMLGAMEIEEWEQWFDVNELKNIMSTYCSDIEVQENIDIDDIEYNGIFCIWSGTVKK